MNFLFNLLAPILGLVTLLFYPIVGNVGLTIVLFTLVIKIIMFPFSVKQQKTTAKQSIFQPKIREIQTKYRGNAQKQQEEIAKLQKQGYNLSGGCLPAIVTMLVLFGVIGVVYKPMTYFEKFDKDAIADLKKIAIETEYYYEAKDLKSNKTDKSDKTDETAAVTVAGTGGNSKNAETADTAAETAAPKKTKDEKELHKTISRKFDTLQSELYIISVYKAHPEVFRESGQFNKELLDTLDELTENIMLFNIDFSKLPNAVFEKNEKFFQPLLLVPILSFLFAAGSMVVTMRIQKKTSPQMSEQMGSMKYMMYLTPVMSLFFAFTLPAGAGFYWAFSSALGIVQSLIIYKIWPPEKIKEQALAEMDKKGFKVDNVIVIEKEDGKKVTKKESKMSASERKEYARKRLEEARKRDLEKYGEIGASPKKDDDDTKDS